MTRARGTSSFFLLLLRFSLKRQSDLTLKNATRSIRTHRRWNVKYNSEKLNGALCRCRTKGKRKERKESQDEERYVARNSIKYLHTRYRGSRPCRKSGINCARTHVRSLRVSNLPRKGISNFRQITRNQRNEWEKYRKARSTMEPWWNHDIDTR